MTLFDIVRFFIAKKDNKPDLFWGHPDDYSEEEWKLYCRISFLEEYNVAEILFKPFFVVKNKIEYIFKP